MSQYLQVVLRPIHSTPFTVLRYEAVCGCYARPWGGRLFFDYCTVHVAEAMIVRWERPYEAHEQDVDYE